MKGRLFSGLKSDLRTVLSVIGVVFQQPLGFKGSQIPQCFVVVVAILVLKTVALFDHVLASRAL